MSFPVNGFFANGVPLYFGARKRKKELSPEVKARQEQDKRARERREAMPFSLQMIAPIRPGQTGATNMNRLHDRFTRMLRAEPALLEAAEQLSPAQGDGGALREARTRETQLLEALGPVTDLFMADIEGTKGLPEVISAIENETLREHLMEEYLMHFYHEQDQKIVGVINAIEDKEVKADWSMRILSRPEPRFLTLQLALISDNVKTGHEKQNQLIKQEIEKAVETTGTAQQKPKKKKPEVTETPEELAQAKEVQMILLRSFLHRASASKDKNMAHQAALVLLDLPDADLDKMEIHPRLLVSLGVLKELPEKATALDAETLRYQLMLGLLMHDDMEVRWAAMDRIPKVKNQAQCKELIDLMMGDPDDICRAILLDLRREDDLLSDLSSRDTETLSLDEVLGELQEKTQAPTEEASEDVSGTSTAQGTAKGIEDKYKNGKIPGDEGEPLLTPEQLDDLLKDLTGRPFNVAKGFNEEYPLSRVATNLNRASSDQLKFDIANSLMDRETRQREHWRKLALWQMSFIDDESLKAKFIKSHALYEFPGNMMYVASLMSSIEDEAILDDVADFLEKKDQIYTLACAMFYKTSDGKAVPPLIEKRVIEFCKRAADGKVPVGGQFAHMMLGVVKDPKERLALYTRMFESGIPAMRDWATVGVRYIEPVSSRTAFIELLMASEERFVRSAAVGALTYLPLRDAVKLAKKALTSDDAKIRAKVLEANPVMQWANKYNKAAFFDRLSMPDNTIACRERMAKNAYRIKNAEVRDRVIDRLAHDPDPIVRQSALRSINKIKNTETRAELARRYSHYPDYTTRASMAEVVRQESVPALNALLANMPDATVDMLLKPFDVDPKRVSQQRWVGLVHVLPALQQLALMDVDAGQLQTVAMRELVKLKEHAKSLVNMYNDPEDVQTKPKEVDECFREYRSEILAALVLLGPEPLKHKLTLTLDPFKHQLFAMMKLPKDARLLKPLYDLAHMPGVDPVDVTKVFEMTAGLCVIGQNERAIEDLQKMADAGAIDISAYSKTYLREFLRQFNPGQPPSEAQLDEWDMNMVHNLYYIQDQLSKRNRVQVVSELMTALDTGTLDDFLGNKVSGSGPSNRDTAKDFKRNDLDMNAWLHYNKTREFSTLDDEDIAIRKQMVGVVFDEMTAMMSKLMGSRRQGVAGLLDQQTAQGLFSELKKQKQPFAFEDGKFVHKSEEPLDIKTLESLITMLEKFMAARGVWKQATESENSELLNVKKRFAAMKDILNECDDVNRPCTNYQIKIWDRNPRTGIFLGSHGTNCVAAEGFNNAEMITYITSDAFQMVEIHDKAVSDPVGVAFVYWVEDAMGKRSLVVDSVDVSKKYLKQTDQKLIRDQLSEFLKEFARDVNRGKDTPVLLGAKYNDIPIKDLPKTGGEYRFIGNTRNGQAYVEMLGGIRSLAVWHRQNPLVLVP